MMQIETFESTSKNFLQMVYSVLCDPLTLLLSISLLVFFLLTVSKGYLTSIRTFFVRNEYLILKGKGKRKCAVISIYEVKLSPPPENKCIKLKLEDLSNMLLTDSWIAVEYAQSGNENALLILTGAISSDEYSCIDKVKRIKEAVEKLLYELLGHASIMSSRKLLNTWWKIVGGAVKEIKKCGKNTCTVKTSDEAVRIRVLIKDKNHKSREVMFKLPEQNANCHHVVSLARMRKKWLFSEYKVLISKSAGQETENSPFEIFNEDSSYEFLSSKEITRNIGRILCRLPLIGKMSTKTKSMHPSITLSISLSDDQEQITDGAHVSVALNDTLNNVINTANFQCVVVCGTNRSKWKALLPALISAIKRKWKASFLLIDPFGDLSGILELMENPIITIDLSIQSPGISFNLLKLQINAESKAKILRMLFDLHEHEESKILERMLSSNNFTTEEVISLLHEIHKGEVPDYNSKLLNFIRNVFLNQKKNDLTDVLKNQDVVIIVNELKWEVPPKTLINILHAFIELFSAVNDGNILLIIDNIPAIATKWLDKARVTIMLVPVFVSALVDFSPVVVFLDGETLAATHEIFPINIDESISSYVDEESVMIMRIKDRKSVEFHGVYMINKLELPVIEKPELKRYMKTYFPALLMDGEREDSPNDTIEVDEASAESLLQQDSTYNDLLESIKQSLWQTGIVYEENIEGDLVDLIIDEGRILLKVLPSHVNSRVQINQYLSMIRRYINANTNTSFFVIVTDKKNAKKLDRVVREYGMDNIIVVEDNLVKVKKVIENLLRRMP